jgi:uncharacterized protein YqjF (DUF2071 family)
MEFLSAHWKHLLLANYVVDPGLLEPLVPAKTKLDFFRGDCYVSLVAFLFDHTRILGIPVPFHRRFEEVNLRFYVVPDRDRSLRAVTFIREIVPKSAIPLIANNLFNENYVATPMSHRFEPQQENENGVKQADYRWGKNLEHRIVANIDRALELPPPGSLGEFITEHYWGYAKGHLSIGSSTRSGSVAWSMTIRSMSILRRYTERSLGFLEISSLRIFSTPLGHP